MNSKIAATNSNKLPIRRVLEPDEVAALAVHIMTNTALTGATFDVDGGGNSSSAHSKRLREYAQGLAS
jgi:NAD(P)-dependent dehydrogenase (short-subunit alcohol dehydrogenase family)